MKWLAVCVLAILGLVEFVLRCVFTLALICTILGLLVVLEAFDSGSSLIEPRCWRYIDQIIDLSEASARELGSAQRRIDRLLKQNAELQEIVVWEGQRKD